jgi:hypothetical protein
MEKLSETLKEFKQGDKVTFLSCGDAKRMPAKVLSVSRDKDGQRVFYELSGNGVLSRTTGKSILESEYCCDQAANYTNRQFRDVDGKMWVCLSKWAGNHKDYVFACCDGKDVATIEISEIHRFEQ